MPPEAMELPFTHKPGRRERHLRRRHGNPLFGWPPPQVAPEALLAAQRADHEEMEAFREDFRALVQRAVELPPDAGSDTVLALKESLERHYEQSFGLPEDHAREREAMRKLIDLIMRAIRRAADADALAARELADEAEAREIHFRLLEQPLVADLLHPESPITPDELAPALLSATPEELAAALELFDDEQVGVVLEQSQRLIDKLSAQGVAVETPLQRAATMLARLTGGTGARH